MIDPLPPHKRMQVRAMLAGTFRGTAGLSSSEQKAAKEGSRPARSPSPPDASQGLHHIHPDQIRPDFAEGEYVGFQALYQALLKLVEEDRVKCEGAFQVPIHPQDFRLMVQSLSLDASR